MTVQASDGIFPIIEGQPKRQPNKAPPTNKCTIVALTAELAAHPASIGAIISVLIGTTITDANKHIIMWTGIPAGWSIGFSQLMTAISPTNQMGMATNEIVAQTSHG
jgi:hypothetical protein